jgi:quercetin dioxygenase-like cupin family protein
VSAETVLQGDLVRGLSAGKSLKADFRGSVILRSSRKMSVTRIFNSSDFFQPTDGEPIRSVVTGSRDATIVAWYIKPNQEIPAHIHPHGQDTWTILSGTGDYYLDKSGKTQPIVAGDVVIAPIGRVHGVVNTGEEPLFLFPSWHLPRRGISLCY